MACEIVDRRLKNLDNNLFLNLDEIFYNVKKITSIISEIFQFQWLLKKGTDVWKALKVYL